MMSRTTLRSGSAQSRQPNCVGPRPVSCHHPSQVNFLPFSTVWACQWALQNLLTYLRVVSARHQTVLNWTRFWTAASALVPALILYPRYQTLLIMLMTHYFQAVMKNPCHVLYHYFPGNPHQTYNLRQRPDNEGMTAHAQTFQFPLIWFFISIEQYNPINPTNRNCNSEVIISAPKLDNCLKPWFHVKIKLF